MKKLIAAVIFIGLLFCSTTSFAEVSLKEAKDAFYVTFEVFRNTQIIHSAGFRPEGVKVEEGNLYFDDANLYFLALVFHGKYQTVSGKIIKINDSEYKADLYLKGGAVNHMVWKMTNYDKAEKIYTAAVDADGTKLTCTVEETLTFVQK